LLTISSDLEDFYRQLPGTVNFSDIYRNAWLEGYANRNRLSLEAPLGNLNSRSSYGIIKTVPSTTTPQPPLPCLLVAIDRDLDGGVKLALEKSKA
jgi:hypothetical protein